jgi:hypothetical protein
MLSTDAGATKTEVTAEIRENPSPKHAAVPIAQAIRIGRRWKGKRRNVAAYTNWSIAIAAQRRTRTIQRMNGGMATPRGADAMAGTTVTADLSIASESSAHVIRVQGGD